MKLENIATWTNRISGGAVLLLAIFGFALSYNALWELSARDLPDWAAIIWPLLIDLALIVFSIAVLRAYLFQETAVWPWALVGLFTLLTVAFNLLHANQNIEELDLFIVSIPIKYLVAVVPPMALVLSFETLMAMIKRNTDRLGAIQSLTELQAEVNERQAEAANLGNEVDNLRGQLESLDRTIEGKRTELDRLTEGANLIYIPDNLTIEQRQQVVNRMANDGITNGDIAEALGVSEGTIKNDKRAIRVNGNG